MKTASVRNRDQWYRHLLHIYQWIQ